MKTNWTHDELVKRAVRWLKNTLNCGVTLKEPGAMTLTGESPDAIGWVNNKCIVIECKSSKSDFYAERKKRSRNWNLPVEMKNKGIYYPALGHYRFYLTPPDLLKDTELPDGWGLYEVRGKTIRHIKGPKYKKIHKLNNSDRSSEVELLLTRLRKDNILLEAAEHARDILPELTEGPEKNYKGGSELHEVMKELNEAIEIMGK